MSSTPGPTPPSDVSSAAPDAPDATGVADGALVPDAVDAPEVDAPEADAPAAEPELPAGAEVEARGVEVADVVEAGTVRRAPRYRAFFWAGAVLGFLVGGVAGFSILSDKAARGIDKPGVLFTVVLVGGVTLGLLVAGFFAVIADRRSLRRR